MNSKFYDNLCMIYSKVLKEVMESMPLNDLVIENDGHNPGFGEDIIIEEIEHSS